ncbi:MAG TPA: MlaD family protein [Solirubrobacteraceae bacterium]|nr:MlaD family protein [Solirubrobacteraceae bacterium]
MTSGRHAVLAVLAAAVVAVAAVMLLSGGGAYVLHAEFDDAGQLVTGDRVEAWGVPIGTVTQLSLTADGRAAVTLSIGASPDTPLHAGTHAVIRAAGLAGVANRYVDLEPGPATARTLPSGSTLSPRETSGIVDIDELLDTLDRPTRRNIEALTAHSAEIFAGSGARFFNKLLATLSPALAQTAGFYGQLAQDRVGLGDLISTADTTATALASRDPELQDALRGGAAALTAVARQQAPLSDALQRLPSVLTQATSTLSSLRSTIAALRPTLRAVPAAAAPLATVLRQTAPTARAATPALAALNGELPVMDRTLAELRPLRATVIPALSSSTTALRNSQTILTGLRYYAADFLLGVTNGLGGIAAGNYDENGHYARVEFVNAPQTAAAGIFSALVPSGTIIPNTFGVREHLTARCPGGDAPPAPDGSNPWVLGSFWCNPADDVPLSVDFP